MPVTVPRTEAPKGLSQRVNESERLRRCALGVASLTTVVAMAAYQDTLKVEDLPGVGHSHQPPAMIDVAKYDAEQALVNGGLVSIMGRGYAPTTEPGTCVANPLVLFDLDAVHFASAHPGKKPHTASVHLEGRPIPIKEWDAAHAAEYLTDVRPGFNTANSVFYYNPLNAWYPRLEDKKYVEVQVYGHEPLPMPIGVLTECPDWTAKPQASPQPS
jgi:hypothetical protein